MDLLPVGTLVRFIREWLEASEALSDAWVVGEISNYSRSAAGHQYFTLKDDRGSLRSVLFRGDDRGVALANGDGVFVHGRVSLYEPRGELQFICDFVRPEGVGLQAAQYEELRERLEREGLFDIGRKRALPRFPLRIGLVTSPNGAALQDIRNVLARRWPLAELVLAPAVVQGKTAPAAVLRALQRLAEEDLDLAIVARGGGSSEDLAAFNDEAIARAVFAFPVPVVTGVGHDTDVSIVDYVADLHAPTPSAAVERATPNWIDVLASINRSERGMRDLCRRQAREFGEDVADWSDRMRRAMPEPSELMADVARLLRHIGRDASATVARAEAQSASTADKLTALSPISTLERGYAIVHLAEKRKVVRKVREVKPGARLTVSVVDGAFSVEVS